MTDDEFRNLKTGDIVQGIASSIIYVVTSNYGDRATAVTTADMTAPKDWRLVQKAARDDDD